MNLSKQQKIAIRNPCFYGDETGKPQYFWRTIDPLVTCGLTVNVGME